MDRVLASVNPGSKLSEGKSGRRREEVSDRLEGCGPWEDFLLNCQMPGPLFNDSDSF